MGVPWRTGAVDGLSGTARRASKRIRGWRYPYPSAAKNSPRLTRRLRRTRIRRSFLDPVQESDKQALLVPSVVVTEHVLVQVRLKVLGRYPAIMPRPQVLLSASQHLLLRTASFLRPW